MKGFLSTYVFVIIFQVLLNTLPAQTNFQEFKAFGVNPSVPNDSLFKALTQAKTITETFKASNNLIAFHERRGNLDSIVFYGNKLYAQVLASNTKNKSNYLAKAALVVANGKYAKGLYDEAFKWYLNGVDYAKASRNQNLLLENQLGLGVVMVIRGNTEEGITMVKTCIDEAPTELLKHDAYKQLGNIMFNTEHYKDAYLYYEKANTFYAKQGLLKRKLETDLYLGRLFEIQGNNEKAINHYSNVFNEALKNNFFMLYAKAGKNIGTFYIKESDYESAKKILSTVYINAIQWGNLEIEKQAVYGLQRAHAKTGDFKNAYALMTQFVRVNEDILKKQNKQQVNELEVQYKTLQQKQEIDRQKTMKTSLLVGFIIVLLPVLGLLYMYYQKLQTQSKLNKTQEEINAQKVTTLLKDQELKLIKASLEGQDQERKRISKELHDSIGGNLATIKLQLSNQDSIPNKIIQQIDHTYNQVRELSHNLMPKEFKNTAFTTLVAHYITNLKDGVKDNIALQMHPETEINALPETIKIEIFKIIQELITNALKHAKATQIDVQISKYDQNLKLIFEDNGLGFNKNQIKYGLGFTNITDRLKNLGGHMFIDTFPNKGTVIDIDIPLN